MVDAVGGGVLSGVGAAVVVSAVVERADHPTATQPLLGQEPREGVAAAAGPGLGHTVRPFAGRAEQGVDPGEGIPVDQRLVHGLAGVDPGVGWVSGLPGAMA